MGLSSLCYLASPVRIPVLSEKGSYNVLAITGGNDGLRLDILKAVSPTRASELWPSWPRARARPQVGPQPPIFIALLFIVVIYHIMG